jgi:hypothetical protein
MEKLLLQMCQEIDAFERNDYMQEVDRNDYKKYGGVSFYIRKKLDEPYNRIMEGSEVWEEPMGFKYEEEEEVSD